MLAIEQKLNSTPQDKPANGTRGEKQTGYLLFDFTTDYESPNHLTCT